MTEFPRGKLGRALDWVFRDRTTGAVTIAQRPNLSLWSFVGLTALAWLAHGLLGPSSPAVRWLGIAGHIALAWWALDELLRGVNPWRRFLGVVALLWIGASLIAARTF